MEQKNELRKYIKTTLREFLNENQSNKWYLVKNGDEFFAEKITKLPRHDKPSKVLFRDFNNNVMSLGKDVEWASDWIKRKNDIDFGF
jgi:hypothetical protein